MEELRNQLIAIINSIELPFEAKFYIVKDVYREVWDTYQKSLQEKEKGETE